jgi:hypothetical protein
MPSAQRTALFISHATPESNAFTLWLGAKLAVLGFEVFADIMRLKGGNDWERILEDAIRNKAGKFLLVATPVAVDKQGVRNEIRIASETAKKIGDKDFIVPLRLEAFDAPLGIAHAQWIDFSKGWSRGLSELLELLKPEKAIVPAITPNNADFWRGLQLKDARAIGLGPEKLISNWLAIEALPEVIRFYDFKSGISIGAAEKAKQSARLPLVPHNRGFLSFAPPHDLQEYFGPQLPIDLIGDTSTGDFLNNGWSDQNIRAGDARRKFSDLARRALDSFFESRSLLRFEIANGHNAWWPPVSDPLKSMLSFSWPDGPSGRRQIIGKSDKRGFYWHYGVVCSARSVPIRHVRVAARVIFTTNGKDVYGDAARLHRLRRSFCKAWRNDKWRDLLLTFWHWIGNGAEFVDVPFGDGVQMRLRLPPVMFEAAFGVESPDDATPSDDDEDEEPGNDEPDLPADEPDDEDEE